MPAKKKPGVNATREQLVNKAPEENSGASAEQFQKNLEQDSDSDKDVVGANSEVPPTEPKKAETAFGTSKGPLSDAEKELIREDLKKTEDEIITLKQVLIARQKHAADLKRQLGLNPLTELTQDINKTLKGVTETDAYKTTSEVAGAAADSVKNKWNDMRNSSLFKSFESKLGSAYNNAKMAASTSIDHLAGAARGSQATSPSTEEPHTPGQQQQ